MRKLGLFVLIAHFSIALLLTVHHFATRQFKPAKPITVRTVLPATPQPKVVAVAPTPKPAPAIVKKTSPPKPAKAAAPAKKQEKAISDIAETLKLLSEPAPQTKTALTLPRKIPSKAEVTTDIKDLSYGEFLIAYLQEALELPEVGEVRARLKINAQGMLVSCEILASKSDRNAEFLKMRLPALTYPVTEKFKGDSFTVTFRNIETP